MPSCSCSTTTTRPPSPSQQRIQLAQHLQHRRHQLKARVLVRRLAHRLATRRSNEPTHAFARHVDTGARWRLGTRVERLETQRKVVHLPGGEEIKYDGLIIATGVEPRHLKGVPRHSPRVHTLRTVDEAMAVKRTIHESNLPIVVMGTGYIGCDVAASARKMGRDVTMIGRSRFPLRNLGNDVASAVDTLHRKHNARMAMGTDIRNWVVSDDSIAMHTTDGQLLVAGCVIMAVGSIPAVEWMRGSGLVLEDGVLCDSTLFAAGANDVVAAGDCARFPNLRFDDTPRRIEHWINAVEMRRLPVSMQTPSTPHPERQEIEIVGRGGSTSPKHPVATVHHPRTRKNTIPKTTMSYIP